MKKCVLETSDDMQPGKKSKKIGISFSIFFCRGLKSASWKNSFFYHFLVMSDFPEKHPKNADVFFKWKWSLEYFLFRANLLF